ncbi:hemoblobin-interacting domain-containing protein [Lysinibacillus sp. BW-2-10]|uniref:hemoblobin-interacting domain-containing protein n=1 Tax=Lysinibacillus sp. BW-2-10 TaxID=2590030 RepID=UPI00117C060E|nr:hemoblobin-interacting domain-containing protein [Lysinibacillus sp. BW-2-10]TSI07368.1 DUF1533 domain-containing protein [Lysinibacillus sp. BW-2-10]
MKGQLKGYFSYSKQTCSLMLGAAIIVAPFSHVENAHAESINIKGDILLGENTQWMSSKVTVQQNKVMIDTSGHFPMLDSNSLTIAAASSNTSIASVNQVQNVVEIAVNSNGKAIITLTATDHTGLTIVENFQIVSTKMGDINGDGNINSSDALFVFQVINGKVTLSDTEKLKLDMDGNGIINANDAAIIMNTASGKNTSINQSKDYYVDLNDINDVPIAHGVQFAGNLKVGSSLTGQYFYHDIENDTEATKIQWYRGSLQDGSDKVAIDGATATTYTLQEIDQNQYIFFEVLPIASSGAKQGEKVIFTSSEKVVPFAPQLADFTWGQGNAAGTTSATDIASGNLKYTIGSEGQFTRPHVGDDASNYSQILNVNSDISIEAGQYIYIASIDEQNKILGWSAVKVNPNMIKLNTPPTLTPDQTINHVGMPISLKFEDRVEWRNAISDILVDSVSINGKYTVNAGEIILSKDVFDTVKDYEIKITANKFEEAVLTQTLLPNEVPVVNNVEITGTAKTGKVLTGNYTYSDIENDQEGTSQFKWYRGSSQDGSDKAEIVGATAKTYTLTEIDVDQYIFFEVIPVANSGEIQGSAVISEVSGKVVQAPALSLVATPFLEPLTEANLNAATVILTLEGDVFKAADELSISDFQLNNAPVGLEIAGVVPMDTTSVWLILENDSPDFDTDISNFSVTAKSSALVSGEEVTSNEMTITAIREPEEPVIFISEFLYKSQHEIAVELFSNYRMEDGYTLEVYQTQVDDPSKHNVLKAAIDFKLAAPVYLILDETYYSGMDELPISGYHYNEYLSLNNFKPQVVNAIILKKGTSTVDVLGNPNSTVPILNKSGTLIRKPNFIGGTNTITDNMYQWKFINTNIFDNYGKHTP